MKSVAIFPLAMGLFPLSIWAQEAQFIPLHTGWEFSPGGKEEWHSASIPGTIHTDLMAHQLIPDPYALSNENVVQWVGQTAWDYRLKFSLPKQLRDYSHLDLVFEGIDAQAEVVLNGETLFHADNMFRTYRMSLKNVIRAGENILMLHFPAPESIAKARMAQFAPVLPGEERVHVRKAQYEFGWDWGPRLITCGLWKPVRIEAHSSAYFHQVTLQTESISDSLAWVTFSANILGKLPPNARILAFDEGAGLLMGEFQPNGRGTFRGKLRFDHPRLWWANGMGKQELYRLRFALMDGETEMDSRRMTTGLRTIELAQDSDAWGRSFQFVLNGKPFFAKGANFIPTDNFPHRTTPSEYEHLLGLAKVQHLNMVRVWGGGIYENNSFYEKCDSLGILVWQDFMFACAMYPWDSVFMENVRAEAEDNLIRLNPHPCIALWCGNNENREGWFHWGWQKSLDYSREDSQQVWAGYQALFEDLLPTLVNRWGNGTDYWPSSPYRGWGDPRSLQEGDSHYWGVWWGKEPFETYTRKVGRFASEYGFQAMPSPFSLPLFVPDSAYHLGSQTLRSHQKHPTGFETLDIYLQREGPIPTDLNTYSYATQVIQAHGIQTAVEAHRRAMPKCMGSLYWQLNDCWPVTSWSAIDAYGHPKALHFALNHAFFPELLSWEETADSVFLYLVLDPLEKTNGTLQVFVEKLSGSSKLVAEMGGELDPGSQIIFGLSKKAIRKYGIGPNAYFHASWTGANEVSANYYSVPTRALKLTSPHLSLKPGEGEFRGMNSISAPHLVKDLALYLDEGNGYELIYFGDLEANVCKWLPHSEQPIKAFARGPKGAFLALPDLLPIP